LMGSPETETGRSSDEHRHEICLKKLFGIGKYEITFKQYDRFCEATGREKPDDEGWGRGDRPVINVDWFDAKDYTAWLSKQTGKTYRLPTEYEWEYAASAGSKTAFPWGNEIGKNLANCRKCDNEWDFKRTAPVASFSANAWGLHDTVGNVWEWTCSIYSKASQVQTCDLPVTEGVVWRGGSWFNLPRHVRSAYRPKGSPDYRYKSLGFRVVVEGSE
jgi:formylglycine-generating enzyme required for sulfatase activity